MKRKEGRMSRLPPFEGATAWLNSGPLTPEELHGKVVLVDFWTYTCINWLRTLPYLRAWWKRYHGHGLEIIGVHTPEFSFEHDLANVRQSAQAMEVTWPIAQDNDYAVWEAFANHYWPAVYLADAEGHIRHYWYGEGGYGETEREIQRLLKASGASALPPGLANVHPAGIERPADFSTLKSQENYLGYQKTYGFVSVTGVTPDHAAHYDAPLELARNDWALKGEWSISSEASIAAQPEARLVTTFHARDLNLVMGPVKRGAKPVPFRVTLDGKPPGDAHGDDVSPDGHGLAADQRLYQLIRQPGPIRDRRFELTFLEGGVQALCFTFG
jgi:hypothetical protein